MRTLSRWLSLRFRIRARHWKRRALLAERELKAECLRNREREDELITVPMRMGGLFGMPPRTGSVPVRQVAPQAVPKLKAASGPWDSWTWADRQEFEMFWKPEADGVIQTEQQVRERFHNEVIIPRRQPLNDDPYN